MKLSQPKRNFLKLAIASAILAGFVSACGDGLTAARKGNGGSSPFGPSGGGTGGTTAGGSTQTRNPGSASAPNSGYSQDLKTCDQYRGISNSVAQACGATLQQNMDELSQDCASHFNDLYNIDCGGLRDRLQGVFNYCNSDISQFWSYLPQNCQTVLNRYIKR